MLELEYTRGLRFCERNLGAESYPRNPVGRRDSLKPSTNFRRVLANFRLQASEGQSRPRQRRTLSQRSKRCATQNLSAKRLMCRRPGLGYRFWRQWKRDLQSAHAIVRTVAHADPYGLGAHRDDQRLAYAEQSVLVFC